MGKSTISMAIFNSYFDITRGYIHCNRKLDLRRSALLPWELDGAPGRARVHFSEISLAELTLVYGRYMIYPFVMIYIYILIDISLTRATMVDI